ncbi:2'-5' RNA ligase family protein [Streptomyces sp. NPDC059101]|uniref:2'-5' RNA ligase family protein n=1 Tax=Streptomyces sp. NPDC059101 TaxID=3346728 RepID=UPI0036B71042
MPLSSPGLTEVRVQDLHCTLLHAVGLPLDDVEGDTVDAVIEEVTRYAQTLAPTTLTFDRPAIGDVAFEISGWPGRPFTQIVETLTQVMEKRCQPFTAAPSRYPHISLAYTSTGAEAINATDLKAALAAVDQPLSGTVLMDRLHLVEQWHDGAHITWNPIADIALTGAVPA